MDNLVIRNARLIFRNFSGKPSKYNDEGNRNFCVVIPSVEMAEELASVGWNVRYLQPRDDYDAPTPYLQVSVKFDYKPPKISLISGANRTLITEDMVDMLDWEELAACDLVIRPYSWTVGGRSGVKAYLKSMHVAFEVDELDADEELPF